MGQVKSTLACCVVRDDGAELPPTDAAPYEAFMPRALAFLDAEAEVHNFVRVLARRAALGEFCPSTNFGDVPTGTHAQEPGCYRIVVLADEPMEYIISYETFNELYDKKSARHLCGPENALVNDPILWRAYTSRRSIRAAEIKNDGELATLTATGWFLDSNSTAIKLKVGDFVAQDATDPTAPVYAIDHAALKQTYQQDVLRHARAKTVEPTSPQPQPNEQLPAAAATLSPQKQPSLAPTSQPSTPGFGAKSRTSLLSVLPAPMVTDNTTSPVQLGNFKPTWSPSARNSKERLRMKDERKFVVTRSSPNLESPTGAADSVEAATKVLKTAATVATLSTDATDQPEGNPDAEDSGPEAPEVVPAAEITKKKRKVKRKVRKPSGEPATAG